MAKFQSPALADVLYLESFNRLKQNSSEGYRYFIYRDSKNIPTISTGIALVVEGSDGTWTLPKSIDDLIASMGKTGNAASSLRKSLQEIADQRNKDSNYIPPNMPNESGHMPGDDSKGTKAVTSENAWGGVIINEEQGLTIFSYKASENWGGLENAFRQ